ncbi:protein Turandot C-like [Drosophila subpulchrella]|uniref:protein Turandot C-like n=1 Tax=Drosophila subpulchrella TaxID=1486046 RepID=UPI0018A19944|nr:protein Turandot C-like [Drosophila subpulchrella]
MNLAIYTMCLALLLMGPMCSAYSDQERQADRLRVAQIMQSSYDDNTKINSIQELLNIYRRMSPSLGPQDRDRLDNLIKPHTEELLIDGVPSQGGRKSKYAMKILSPVAKSVATGFFEQLGASIASLFERWFS